MISFPVFCGQNYDKDALVHINSNKSTETHARTKRLASSFWVDFLEVKKPQNFRTFDFHPSGSWVLDFQIEAT